MATLMTQLLYRYAPTHRAKGTAIYEYVEGFCDRGGDTPLEDI